MIKKGPISSKPFDVDLQEILNLADTRVWTFRTLFDALKGKGYPFIIVLFSLPFCQPFQIPGFSTPFGILLAFIGLRMAFGKRIWWPQRLLNQKISTRVLKSVIKKSLTLFGYLKPFIHERMQWICSDPYLYLIHGLFVTLMGVILALPLPIPMSNLFAAWSIFCIGLGLLEDDGLFVIIGYSIGLGSLILFGLLIFWLHSWSFSQNANSLYSS